MKSIALLVSLLACVAAPASCANAATLEGSRPNIILVITDDQGKGDLSCLGNPDLRTPNLDRLHALSTRFRDFHVSPTCAPTRSAIMSGRHEFKNGVTHTILERERMALSTTTVAQVLQAARYKTAIFGKWHLGDEEPYQPHRRGFGEVFIHGAGGIGQAFDCSCADAPPNRQNRYFDCVIRHNTKFVKTEGFCTDVFFQAALGWIKQQKDGDQPFFAYISTNAPHGPMIAPQKYKQPFLDAGFDESTAGRYGMIANIDDNVGRLMQRLDDWDLFENTLLIFMTDNGQAGRNAQRDGKRVALYTAGLKNGKGSPNEGGTRVPAFWCWKGVLGQGQNIDALTAHLDIFPTLVALAGATLPTGDQVEGRSLLPLLDNPKANWSDRFLFTHKGRWRKGDDPRNHKHDSCAVRTERFRLVNDKELYEIDADPGEISNVIEQHPDMVAAMRAAYDAWWNETLPLMVNEDTPNSAVKPFWVLYEKQLQAEGIPDWNPTALSRSMSGEPANRASGPCIAQTCREAYAAVTAARAAGKTIGVVPTMGALHEGHLSLVRASNKECAFTAVTIFVNPTQFGTHEDLDRYPRTLDADLEALSQFDVDLVFVPHQSELYPEQFSTFVQPGQVAQPLEGRCRPGHFRGVATIVLKLLNIIPADRAFFGQKDYQQSVVIRQMVADLNLPVAVRVCPIVREPDGLAMSSRNAYLDPAQRRQALALSESLELADNSVHQGELDPHLIKQRMRDVLASAGITQIDYVAIVDPQSLEDVARIDGPAVALVAASVGQTRLIDNRQIG